MPWLKRLNWSNTLFLIGTPLLVAILVPITLIKSEINFWDLGLFLVMWLLTGLSITAGYHRLFSHRSYEAKSWVKVLYLIFGAAALEGSALKWSTDHRRHHRFVDREEDPYNIHKGFWWAHVGWVFFKEEEKYVGKFAPDLEKDPLVAWQHRWYVSMGLVVTFGLPTLIALAWGHPWQGFLVGGLARIIFTHHCTFFINSLAHLWGSRPYSLKNTARDNFFLALLTYGEGYHNFHHRFQADYRNGVRWWQWDPTKWLIRGLSWTGQTSKLKRVSEEELFKTRVELDALILTNTGFGHERIQELRRRMELARDRWQELKTQYSERKEELRARGRHSLKQWKLDLRIAKMEFRASLAQWKTMVKAQKSLMPVS